MPTNIVVCLCYPLVVAIVAALVGFSLITWGDLSSSPDGMRRLQTHPRQRWEMSRQLYKYARKEGKGGVSGRNSSGKRQSAEGQPAETCSLCHHLFDCVPHAIPVPNVPPDDGGALGLFVNEQQGDAHRLAVDVEGLSVLFSALSLNPNIVPALQAPSIGQPTPPATPRLQASPLPVGVPTSPQTPRIPTLPELEHDMAFSGLGNLLYNRTIQADRDETHGQLNAHSPHNPRLRRGTNTALGEGGFIVYFR